MPGQALKLQREILSQKKRKEKRKTNQRLKKDAIFCLFLFFCFSRQGFSVVLVPVLELPLYTRLASNSQRSTCLCLPSVRIKSLHHHRTAKGAILIDSNHTYYRALTFYFVCLFQDRVSLCKQH